MNPVSVLAFFLFCYLLGFCHSQASAINEPFFVRPNQGSDSVIEKELKGTVCRFEYKSVGGAGEEWTISMKEQKGKVICEIGRPNMGSYLFFQKFSASLNKPLVSAEVWDNSGALLKGDAWVDKEDTGVQNAPGWTGMIKMVTLTAETKKTKKKK